MLGDNIYNKLGGAESGQNPTAHNPTSSAAGYYQITTGTWQDFAPKAGVSLAQYPTADLAPLTTQTAVANNIPLKRWVTWPGLSNQFPGVSDTMTLGQAAALTSSDASQVQVSAVTPGNIPAGSVSGTFEVTDPATGQSLGTGGFGGTGNASSTGVAPSGATGASAAGAGQPGYLPPSQSGGPAATGITPGLAAGITGWITDIETKTGNAFSGAVSSVEAGVLNAFKGALSSVEDWTVRGFLILIGVLILAIALWKLFDPDGEKTKAAAEHLAMAA